MLQIPSVASRRRLFSSKSRIQVQGTLHIVATPLGNLDDTSRRAMDTLQRASLILAEDTRVARKLMRSTSEKPTVELPVMMSCNDYNESDRIKATLSLLASGSDVAIVSDAGTPAISDPGSSIVAAALKAGMRVSPVPGPCAFVAALSASGLQLNADHGGEGALFVGFLPRHGESRRRWLAEISSAHARRAVVMYEAPHRVLDTLRELAEWHEALHGRSQGVSSSHATEQSPDFATCSSRNRPVLVARELTKRFETITLCASIREALQLVSSVQGGREALDSEPSSGDTRPRGEFTLVLYPTEGPAPTGSSNNAQGSDHALTHASVDGHSDAGTHGLTAPSAYSGMGSPWKGPAESNDASMADAIDLVKELTQQRGMRVSEAIATAAQVAGVRRKSLMTAVALSGILSSREKKDGKP